MKRITKAILISALIITFSSSAFFAFYQFAQIKKLQNDVLHVEQNVSQLEKLEKGDTHDLQRVRNVVKNYKDSIVRLFGKVDREKIKERRKGNGWSLQMAEKNGRFFGTGWFVREDLLVTNYHVTDLMKNLHVQLPSGKKVRGNVLVESQKYDLALIDPNLPEDYNTKPLQLADNSFKRYKEIIHFGYPYKMNYFSFGATLKRDSWGYKGRAMTIKEHPVYQVKLKSGPGASGSPIFDKNGKVVGIMEAGRRGFDSSLIIPSKYIQKLFDKLNKKELRNSIRELKEENTKLKLAVKELSKQLQELQKKKN